MYKSVLIKPYVMSEKADRLSEQLGKYVFIVSMDANKIEIRNAVEDMYGVTVEKVNTMIMPSKRRSRFTRSGLLAGKTKKRKKAVITLAEGESIDFYENV